MMSPQLQGTWGKKKRIIRRCTGTRCHLPCFLVMEAGVNLDDIRHSFVLPWRSKKIADCKKCHNV